MHTKSAIVSIAALLLVVGFTQIHVAWSARFEGGIGGLDCSSVKRQISRDWFELRRLFRPDAKDAFADREPQRARVSSTTQLSEGLFCLSEHQSFLDTNRQAAYEQLQAAARLTRTWGDCYGHLLVATGRAVLTVDPVINAWDARLILMSWPCPDSKRVA